MANTILVAGLGFGDEGKGGIVDYLTRTTGARVVVRYNGGAQAAHNVVTSNGTHHTFSQFGSGTLIGAQTHLSKHMLVNPIFLLAEAKHLEEDCRISDPMRLVSIHKDALITNPFQVALNRLKEINRGGGRHGSCGMGINETVVDSLALGEDSLRAKDLKDPSTLKRKLKLAQEAKLVEAEALPVPQVSLAQIEIDLLLDTKVIDSAIEQYTQIAKSVRIVDDTWLGCKLTGDGTIIFEGAQGVLLDQNYGFFPHVTRSNTTFANAYDLLGTFDGAIHKIGVTRAYMTRHGAGPFPTEDKDMTFQGEHNNWGPWQEGFRYGHLDLVLLQYALDAIGGVDEIAMTCIDHLPNQLKVCVAYDSPSSLIPRDTGSEAAQLEQQRQLTEQIYKATPCYQLHPDAPGSLFNVPILIRSTGPTAEDKSNI